jgi:hypothetical protein
MKILDDLVPVTLIDNIEKTLLSHTFPWYLNENVVDKYPFYSYIDDEKTNHPNQFTHQFFNKSSIQSQYYHLVTPIICLLEKQEEVDFTNRIIRIKANLLTRQNYEDDHYNSPHVDSKEIPGESLLYYVNDSDGDTFIFNENKQTDKLTINSRISPQRGRCLFFNSDYFHASSCPRKNETRVVINFLFRKQGIS